MKKEEKAENKELCGVSVEKAGAWRSVGLTSYDSAAFDHGFSMVSWLKHIVK